jgi:phosphatidylglycerol:prolipoprotein diacylglycerol transferase
MSGAFWFGSFVPERMLLDFGFVHIYWYSLLVTLGIAVAAYIGRSRYVSTGGKEQQILDFFFYVIIGGLIGARLWHVLVFQWAYYADHLSDIVKIWEGGIAIQGALLGGLFAAYVYTKKKHLDFLFLADTAVIGVPLAQAVGRWGNFFNQELYGLPTKFPWGMYIEPQNRVAGYEAFSHFHPTFLYESVLNVLFFWLLWQYSKKNRMPGTLTAFYFIGYGAIRFIVDFARIDPMPMIGFLRASQVISVIFVLVASMLWYFLARDSVAK